MWLHNCVTTFAIIAVMSSCRDIMCESIPGSLPPFLFFVGARGEPGNEATQEYLWCTREIDKTLWGANSLRQDWSYIVLQGHTL